MDGRMESEEIVQILQTSKLAHFYDFYASLTTSTEFKTLIQILSHFPLEEKDKPLEILWSDLIIHLNLTLYNNPFKTDLKLQ